MKPRPKSHRAPESVTLLLGLGIAVSAFGIESDSPQTEIVDTHARSEHFELISPLGAISPTATARILEWLEASRVEVLGVLGRVGLIPHDSAERFEVTCLAAGESPPGVELVGSGVYDRATGMVFLTDCAAADEVAEVEGSSMKDASAVALRLTLRHEVSHQIVDRTFAAAASSMPTWFSEGLACAFEDDIAIEGDRIRVRNRWRSADMRDMVERSGRESVVAQILDRLRSDQAWKPAFGDDPVVMTAMTYAMDYASAAYLLEEKSSGVKVYLQDLAASSKVDTEDRRAAFAHQFGSIDRALADNILRFVLAEPIVGVDAP